MRKTLDVRGLACPLPVIEARKAMKEMEEGVLEILAGDSIAVQNLTRLGEYSHAAVSSVKLEDDSYKVVFRLGEPGPGEEASENAQDSPACRKGSVVVLSSDTMGGGDERLGHILMKGFVYAMTQLEELPETVLMYNGGARLSTEGSESLEDLRALEALGVEILTCGTCLDYYNLSAALRVGGVTNMYSIAEKLAGASVVIRP